MTMQRGIPILTYHSLDESGSVISTRPSIFRRQMEFFKKNGFHCLSLNDVVGIIRSGGSIPERCFAITFDDGYKNVYTEAFPILRDLGFHATVFLITDYCGRTNQWPGQNPAIPDLPLATWDQIHEMHNAGFALGAHTRTHPDLTRIPTLKAEEEIVSSKLRIESTLGITPRIFAYPYGCLNAAIKDIVSRHFIAACSTRLAKASLGSDPCDIPRLDTFYLSSEAIFTRISGRIFDCYISARNRMRVFKNRFLAL